MKTIPVALAAHYATPWHTICTCLKIVRADAVVLGFTTYNRAITVDGVVYIPGFDISAISSSESLAVDNLELTIEPDADVTEADLVTGLWNYARFQVFECNYTAPADGINTLKFGSTGQVKLARSAFVLEFLSDTQKLQQAQGIAISKTCRALLGDAKCTKSLTAFTHDGTLTAVTNSQVFADSGIAQAEDYFGEGIIQFTGGDNAGYRQKIKTFVGASGQYTTSLPLPFPPQVGDTYTAIAGCRKRLAEDCKTKFANAVNFQGEPHLPGQDALTKSGLSETQSASTPTLPAEG